MLKEVSAKQAHDEQDGHFYYARDIIDWSVARIEPPYTEYTGCPSRAYYKRLYATAVYIIGPVDAPYCKIGMSVLPALRLTELQIGSWERLKVHYSLFVYDDKAYEVEQSAIVLAALRGIEVRGEWVGMRPEEAFRMVLDAAEIANVPACSFATAERNEQDIANCRMQSRLAISAKRDREQKALKWARLGY